LGLSVTNLKRLGGSNLESVGELKQNAFVVGFTLWLSIDIERVEVAAAALVVVVVSGENKNNH
jgi:hypothetical protein